LIWIIEYADHLGHNHHCVATMSSEADLQNDSAAQIAVEESALNLCLLRFPHYQSDRAIQHFAMPDTLEITLDQCEKHEQPSATEATRNHC